MLRINAGVSILNVSGKYIANFLNVIFPYPTLNSTTFIINWPNHAFLITIITNSYHASTYYKRKTHYSKFSHRNRFKQLLSDRYTNKLYELQLFSFKTFSVVDIYTKFYHPPKITNQFQKPYFCFFEPQYSITHCTSLSLALEIIKSKKIEYFFSNTFASFSALEVCDGWSYRV